MLESLIILSASALITLALSQVMLRYVSIKGFFDIPDARKIHKNATPRYGGIPFVISTLIMSMYLVNLSQSYMWFFYGGIIILILGLVDDIHRISWKVKLLAQVSLCLLTFSHFTASLPSFSFFHISFSLTNPVLIAIFMIWFLGITNAINLIDGMDGLAGGVFFLISLGLAYIGWQFSTIEFMMINLILAINLFSFLCFNGKPARFFMGDTGSLFLGYYLAVSPLLYLVNSNSTTLNLTPFIIISSYFIIDTIRVFSVRIINKQNPLTPDNRHLHHELYKATKSYNSTIFTILLLVSIYILIAIWEQQKQWKLLSLIFYSSALILLTIVPQIKGVIIKTAESLVNLGRSLLKQNKTEQKIVKQQLEIGLFVYFTALMAEFFTSYKSEYFIPMALSCMSIALLCISYRKQLLSTRTFIIPTSCHFILLIFVSAHYTPSTPTLITTAIKYCSILILAYNAISFSLKHSIMYLLRYWFIYDILILITMTALSVMSIGKLPIPFFIPSYTLLMEWTAIYIIIRILCFSIFKEKSIRKKLTRKTALGTSY